MKQKSFQDPDWDYHGFEKRLREMTNELLVEAFNREVGNQDWNGPILSCTAI